MADEQACKEQYLYRMPFSVRYGETGADGLATLPSLGSWLQEVAGHSADALGFGADCLKPYQLTWVLMRMILHIDRLPGIGESIAVESWPSKFHHFGYRGYKIYDAANVCIAHGGSAWAVLDISTRAIAALPEALMARYPQRPPECDDFSCRVIPRISGMADYTGLIRARKDDLDINGHVNNTKYLAWIQEPLPQAWKDAADASFPRMVDISFRAECHPNDELHVLCAADKNASDGAPGRMLHSVKRVFDDCEVCRAVTHW